MKQDGVYFDIYAVKDGKSYPMKAGVSMKELTDILVKGLVDSLGSVITDESTEEIKTKLDSKFQAEIDPFPKSEYVSYNPHDCETYYRCPNCGRVFGSQSIMLKRMMTYACITDTCTCPHCHITLAVRQYNETT